MKNIINKIKNLSLEEVNKNLLVVAVLSLLFRVGNFSTSHLPKPFELIMLFITLLAIIDVIKNNKIKEFFLSIIKNIRIALICLVFSILLGWLVSAVKGIPTTFNTILEFGSFVFSLSVFLLIMFYTRSDKTYIKKYLYALLAPIVYTVFIIFPKIAYNFNLALGSHFVGFTTNPNIVSKTLLIPIIFFSVKTLFENNKYLKLIYLILSSMLVSLLVWTSSRGAILSLSFGMTFIWLVSSLNDFHWNKLLKNGTIIIFICLAGFVLVPSNVKNIVVTRISNTIPKITGNIAPNNHSNFPLKISENINNDGNLRLKIWSFFMVKVALNPFGFGPNTHIESGILQSDGQPANTGPHNSYLQIWLWGGLLGISSFVYILFNILKMLRRKLKSDFSFQNFVLMSILLALLLSVFFDDSFTFPFLWIILALSLSSEHDPKD